MRETICVLYLFSFTEARIVDTLLTGIGHSSLFAKGTDIIPFRIETSATADILEGVIDFIQSKRQETAQAQAKEAS